MDIVAKKNLLNEPRAFWDIISAIATTGLRANDGSTTVWTRTLNGNGQNFALPRQNFTNGSRYPIDLTKMSICPLGYLLRRWNGGISANPDNHEVLNDMSWLSRATVSVTAPKRSRLNNFVFSPGSVPTDPTSDGGMGPISSAPYGSSLMGISRWDFERPFRLVRNGIVQFGMLPVRRSIENVETEPPMPDVGMAFWESHIGASRMLGNSRNKTLSQADAALSPGVYPRGPAAVNADYWDLMESPAGTVSSIPSWSPNMSFDGGFGSSGGGFNGRRSFRKQDTSRGSESTFLTGYSVMLRQIYWDEVLAQEPEIANSFMASLSTRVGTRCRVQDGGTNEWWWRPGAPLALVSPTITPSVVVTLPKTITLGPGESLEVEVNLPPPVFFANASPAPETISPVYQLGISFTGFATVEG